MAKKFADRLKWNLEIIILTYILINVAVFAIVPALKIKVNDINLGLIVLVIYIFLISAVWPVYKMYLGLVKGETCEGDVKHLLQGLSKKGFYHLMDVKAGTGGQRKRYGYIVVGPTGIWTIEVKNPKYYEETGEKFLKAETKRVLEKADVLHKFLQKKHFSYKVTPILVFAHKKSKAILKETPVRGVYVISRDMLEQVLTRHRVSHLSPGNCYDVNTLLKNA